MRKRDLEKCTCVTVGRIVQIENRGHDCPIIVTVKYEIDGTCYRISESKKYKIEIIKFGFLPVGQRSVPKLGNVVVGDPVRVSYNPADPEMAYLTDNTGKINVT